MICTYAPNCGGRIIRNICRSERPSTPRHHPVVRTHPVTNQKGLFVNESMTSFIKDMDRKESDMLLRYLFDYLRTPEFQYRHKWQVNDLAIWDNRTSLHYALFDYTDHRLMHRVVIQGDVPA
jgi:taurine dioxygenase